MIRSIVIYYLIDILCIIFMCKIAKKDWLKTDRSFCIKKIIDCFVYSFTYVMLVYAHYISVFIINPVCPDIPNFIWMIVPCVISGWLSIKLIISATDDIIKFSGYENVIKIRLLFALLSLALGILMSLSVLNYIIYIVGPDNFKVDSSLTFVETSFEFVYYTFSLMLSYSSNSIEVATIFAKILQMVQIVFSYVLLGTVVINLLTKYVNKDESRR